MYDSAKARAHPVLGERYHLDELIGSGGLATVYRARDEYLGRDVAVKIFRASLSAEQDFQRQQNEVNTLAMLNHPYLVTLLDAGVHRTGEEQRIYYVMELVRGSDLKKRLSDGSVSPRAIAQLGYHVASGLEHVHELGIVHRDIKPANILLLAKEGSGSLTGKLSDFGLASMGSGEPVGEGNPVTGTVAYLSPEQARGDLVTTASDVYSFGLVLIECFTRKLAFGGQPQESAAARLSKDPEIDESVPTDWVPLMRAMTDREPQNRPPTPDVVWALRDAFATETGRHRASDTESAPLEVPRHGALADARSQVANVIRDAAMGMAPEEFERLMGILAYDLRTWSGTSGNG